MKRFVPSMARDIDSTPKPQKVAMANVTLRTRQAVPRCLDRTISHVQKYFRESVFTTDSRNRASSKRELPGSVSTGGNHPTLLTCRRSTHESAGSKNEPPLARGYHRRHGCH